MIAVQIDRGNLGVDGMLLLPKCQLAFEQFVTADARWHRYRNDKTLLRAFDKGGIEARSGGDVWCCPYSAAKESHLFLAWLAGFRCCAATASG